MSVSSARKRRRTGKLSLIFSLSCHMHATKRILLTVSSFGAFFNHIDHFPEDNFLYVTSGGLAAAKPADQPKGDNSGDSKDQKRGKSARQALADVEGESEPEGNVGNGEEGG